MKTKGLLVLLALCICGFAFASGPEPYSNNWNCCTDRNQGCLQGAYDRYRGCIAAGGGSNCYDYYIRDQRLCFTNYCCNATVDPECDPCEENFDCGLSDTCR